MPLAWAAGLPASNYGISSIFLVVSAGCVELVLSMSSLSEPFSVLTGICTVLDPRALCWELHLQTTTQSGRSVLAPSKLLLVDSSHEPFCASYS